MQRIALALALFLALAGPAWAQFIKIPLNICPDEITDTTIPGSRVTTMTPSGVMSNVSTAAFDDVTVTNVVTSDDLGGDPPTPAGGKGAWYVKNDIPYFINDLGTKYDLTAGGGGVPANMMTTDTAQNVSGAKAFTTPQTFSVIKISSGVTLTATGALDTNNQLVYVDSSANAVQVNLPQTAGAFWLIKVTGYTNPITLTPTGGTIDGGASYTGLTQQYDAVIVSCDGTDFWLH
jgi:hypothetical protein